MLAVGRDRPELGLFVRAGEQIAVVIEIHSIGASRRLQERGKLAVHGPLHDAVVRLVGEKDIAVGVAGGSFGEFELTGELFQLRAWRNRVWKRIGSLAERGQDGSGECEH